MTYQQTILISLAIKVYKASKNTHLKFKDDFCLN